MIYVWRFIEFVISGNSMGWITGRTSRSCSKIQSIAGKWSIEDVPIESWPPSTYWCTKYHIHNKTTFTSNGFGCWQRTWVSPLDKYFFFLCVWFQGTVIQRLKHASLQWCTYISYTALNINVNGILSSTACMHRSLPLRFFFIAVLYLLLISWLMTSWMQSHKDFSVIVKNEQLDPGRNSICSLFPGRVCCVKSG